MNSNRERETGTVEMDWNEMAKWSGARQCKCMKEKERKKEKVNVKEQ